MVATDRISAFDYVLGSGIPDKGRVLTQLSAFWFERTRHIVANHVLEHRRARFPAPAGRTPRMLDGRSMLVRKTTPLPIECVARGYLSGSGWKDYKATGEVCGVPLPAGLVESDRLPAADLHAGDEGRLRPRSEHLGGRRRAHGRPRAARPAQAADARRSTHSASTTPRRAASSSPTRSSSSA